MDCFMHQEEKFMQNHSKTFIFNEQKYELKFKPITVEKAAQMDFNSYNEDNFSSFFEMRSMIDCIDFSIWQNDEFFYDSSQNNKSLDFLFVKAVYDELKRQFSLSKDESAIFLNDCNVFLTEEKSTNKMPYELLLARNILNGTISLSLSDFENMEIKKYEKIQLALSILQKQVDESEIE